MKSFTIEKVEVWRVVDENGNYVSSEDDYGDGYPIDFSSEDSADEYALQRLNVPHYRPQTKEAQERDDLISAFYKRMMLANLTAPSPFSAMSAVKPLPEASGQTVSFLQYGEQA